MDWTCSPGIPCQGACITTVQMPLDVRTSSTTLSSPLISTQRSDLIGMQILNPITEAFLNPNLASGQGTEFVLPIYGQVNTSQYSLEVCITVGYITLPNVTLPNVTLCYTIV